ncbi:MAG: sensor histidine kinase [Ferruginibacter sp.]
MPGKLIAFIVIFCSGFFAKAQAMPVDSLLLLLRTAKEDTNKIDLLQNLEKAYFNVDNDSALYYNQACEKLIDKLNATNKKHTCYHEFVKLYHAKYDYKTELAYCLKAIAVAKQTDNKFQQATSYRALFNTYHNLRQNDSAVKYGLYSLQLTKSIHDTSNLATNYGNLCWLYKDLTKIDKAIDFGEEGVAVGKLYKDSVGMLISMNNLANCYLTTNQDEKAIELFKEVLRVGKQVKRRRSVRVALINLGTLYYSTGNGTALNQTVNEFNEFVKDDNLMSRSDEAFGKLINGQNFIFQKQFSKAEQEFQKGIAIAEADSNMNSMLDLYNNMSKLKFAMHDFKGGNFYEVKWSNLDQHVREQNLAEYESELNVKYETGKKEGQIKLNNLELRQKTNLNYLFAGAVASLLMALLLGYRTFKQRQELQKQRITELETEKKLTAAEAVLKGEEQERGRLAKDLHDGLGGMLSGIKYSLHMLKGNLIMTPENAQAFERSIDMLDSSIQEMRRVAHNMMPEALVKFGLDTALKDFCNDVNQSGALEVNYQSIGLKDAVISQTTSITIYRIIQELINNTMKHAKATNAIVQITKTGDQLSVTVEDNGKGFDTNSLALSKGIGWSNIQNRVEFLNGRMDVNSQPDKGTSVLLEINT